LEEHSAYLSNWTNAGAQVRATVTGADRASLVTVDVEDMPLAYLPGNALRVRVAGNMRAAAAR
jgi:hypothetical protein